MQTVNITPLAYKLNSPQPNTLGVKLISDNLKDTAILFWELSAVTPASGSTKATSARVDSGNVLITGTDYTNWTGDNTFPFTFTAGKLTVTIVS